ncbi:MAG: hypothetical protein WBA22_00430 [Candidatus Methanofastidiosia archaeon]
MAALLVYDSGLQARKSPRSTGYKRRSAPGYCTREENVKIGKWTILEYVLYVVETRQQR